jgi:hypothetical protein
MLLHSWKIEGDVNFQDPLRSFFQSSIETIRISYEYEEVEITAIATALLRTKVDFPLIMSSCPLRSCFMLALDVLAKWLEGTPRLVY